MKTINSKAQLKREIKNGTPIKFLTIKNSVLPDEVGTVRELGQTQQTNAFTIKREQKGKMVDSYVWYDQIDVKNNHVIFKKIGIEFGILV